MNNYLAVELDGACKTRGAFGDGAKGDGAIIRRAAIDFMTRGTDPAETVAAGTRVEDFLFYQRSRRDAVLAQGATVIGRTARWYCAYSGTPVVRRPLAADPGGAAVETTVNHGHRARLAFDVRGWDITSLVDLDRSYYTAEARRLVESAGVTLPLG